MPSKKKPVLVLLPADLAAELALHCRTCGERPDDVIIDALALHLDELGGTAPVLAWMAEPDPHGSAQGELAL